MEPQLGFRRQKAGLRAELRLSAVCTEDFKISSTKRPTRNTLGESKLTNEFIGFNLA